MTQTSQNAVKNESSGVAFSNNAILYSPGIPPEPWYLGFESGRGHSQQPVLFIPPASNLQVCDSCNRTPSSAFSPSSVPPTTTLPASLAWWSGSARPLDLSSSSLMRSPTMAFPACRTWLVSRWVPAPRSSNSFHGLLSSSLVPISHLKAPYLPFCPHPEHPAWSDHPITPHHPYLPLKCQHFTSVCFLPYGFSTSSEKHLYAVYSGLGLRTHVLETDFWI